MNTKLTGALDVWVQRDLAASWEKLASALEQTPGYGAATAAKFRATARVPGEQLYNYVFEDSLSL